MERVIIELLTARILASEQKADTRVANNKLICYFNELYSAKGRHLALA